MFDFIRQLVFKKNRIKFIPESEEYKEFIPTRGTTGSAGYDIYIPEEVKFDKNVRKCILDSRIKIQIPKGYYADMRIRSSLGIKKQIRLMNSSGVIDSDFKETIKVPLHYYGDFTGNEEIVLHKGERVAQIIFIKYSLTWEDRIKDLFRINKRKLRNGGLGSTGQF